MRLDRCLANSGYGSRTEVKSLIRQGQVSLNGQVIQDAGFAVGESDRASITVAGRTAHIRHFIHLMMHKPAGYITALDDNRHRTIAELIPHNWQTAGLFPVGRLDIDTTGLLILTNDGTLCHRLASPRWEVWKTYHVLVRGRVFDQGDILAFANGLQLADGQACRPAKLEILGAQEALLTIHEGKYHQVKRMMLGTGRRVMALSRLSLGPLELDKKMAPGQCRELTDDEIKSLYDLVDMQPTDVV